MKVIVTGGGTGGHIYPALAIAESVLKEIPNSEVLYIGCEDGPVSYTHLTLPTTERV